MIKKREYIQRDRNEQKKVPQCLEGHVKVSELLNHN
jgi:hypothetical protein